MVRPAYRAQDTTCPALVLSARRQEEQVEFFTGFGAWVPSTATTVGRGVRVFVGGVVLKARRRRFGGGSFAGEPGTPKVTSKKSAWT